MVSVTVVAAVTSLFAWVVWTRSSKKTTLALPLPPGPKRRPVAGNALELPTEYAWEVYHGWAKEHGDVMYIEAFGQSMLVLDTAQAVTDLLEKRSASFSSRRSPRYATDLMGFDFAFVNDPYGPRWRRMRRAMHPHLTPASLPSYTAAQLRGVRYLLDRLLSDPEHFRQHSRAFFGRTVFEMVYGLRDGGKIATYTKGVDESMRTMAECVNPGPHFLLEVIPALKYLPVWKTAFRIKKILQHVLDEPYATLKSKLDKGSQEQPVGALLLNEAGSAHDLNDIEIRDLCGIFYVGGADTTVSVVDTCFLAMLTNPECQAAAHKEVDAVVGRGRLPDYNDRDNLPYISAIVTEVLRWKPTTPMAVPHYIEQDEEYRGWRIPANTVIFPNSWAILHDPEVYPDPETFNPERYLLRSPDGSWTVNPNAPNPRAAAFGYGRRLCPGIHLANQVMYAVVANVLAAFEIVPALDDAGKEIRPAPRMTGAFISHPVTFPCVFRPRFEGAAELVRTAMAEAEDRL